MKNPKASDVKKGIAVLWETLQCPICLDLMTTPISTKCDHQFCKFCITKLLDGSKQSKANCPVCKSKITKRSLQESPGFQRLVAGLQDMIQAYEHDTGTNYFTGMPQPKGDSSVTNVEITENPCNILSGSTFDTNLDNMEQTDNDVLLQSCSSTVEAQNGFAKLMGLEDSAPLTTENEGLDSGLGDAPPTSDKKMSSPMDNLDPETTDIGEKATRAGRSEKKSASLCAAPVREETEHRPLRKSSRTKRKTDSESDKILEQKKKKSLEKVAEWLLKVPAEADLELGKPLEKADDSDSCSSTSTLDVEPHVKLNPRKEDHAKALEEQVFGVVYKRRSNKSVEPPTAAEVLIRKSVSKLRKKTTKTPAEGQQMIENKNDSSSDVFKEAEQIEVNHKHDMSKNVEEFNQMSVSDKNEDHPVSKVVQQQPETVTKKRTRKTAQQVDSDLRARAQTNSNSPEQKKGRTTRSEKKKLNKVAKPLVLVGVQNRASNPKARERSDEVRVQIENYPSSEDQETPVTRSSRKSKRLQLFVEEDQGSHKKATLKTCVPKKDRNVAKPFADTKGDTLNLPPPESGSITKAVKTNGCVYDRDIGGIESLETGESNLARSEKGMPRAETLSEAVADSCTSVLPNSSSQADASVVAPTFENDEPAISPRVSIQQEPPVTEAERARAENEDHANDSELDTEQLLRSFRAAKRKSFHLGDATLKRSRLSDRGTKAGDGNETKQKQMSRGDSKEAEKSSCSDLIPPSNSPIQRRRTTADKPDRTVVEASIPDSSCSGEDNAAGNALSSGLSPNKVSKLDGESPSRPVVLQVMDSGLRFTAVEPEELNEASKGSQVGRLDSGKVSEVDTNEHDPTAESSLTPNDLRAPARGITHKAAGRRSGELSTQSSIKTNSRRKRRAQRLESLSESDSGDSKEELPTLTQLFGTSTRPPAGAEDQGGSDKENGSGSICDETHGAEAQSRPPNCPSPDCIESSQASVDLFGTPEEGDVPEHNTGVSMESSQFSSEVLVTQQKIEMKKELVRLEKLMALVSEVLQEKEGSPGREEPSETHQSSADPGPDRHRPLLHEQDSELASPRTDIPDVARDPSLKPSEEKVVPEASQPRHGGVTETGSAVKDTKTSKTPNSTSAAKTIQSCDPPADGQEDKENNSPPTERRNAKLVLVTSGLGSTEQMMVKKFAKRVGARVVSQVTPEVTHIIMRTDEHLVCERTLKYFLGIAGRKWVVSFQWISECFKQKKLLDESPFEVRGDVVNGPNHQGPLRARNTDATDLLLKGYKICFQGPFTDMSTDEMEWMVELCGAAVVKDPLLLDSKQKSHQLVVVQPRPELPSSTYSGLSRKATVVTRGWLLDTVATYALQNFNDYTT
ncbi:breast cancer type 1 susceptibility protein homolog isoform X2 [Kryptolebias marmoratus]|uniref:breast cancer type 1 susceptibility protein homolog isoform X2 n=1 Tax=Kryptolebias marmoratus TaxID=37003 RepID=UPI0007F8E8B1|nr:breast cancer type 1 susceptibility protein homolog isoform X2 [Kryptolebias marmoratus]